MSFVSQKFLTIMGQNKYQLTLIIKNLKVLERSFLSANNLELESVAFSELCSSQFHFCRILKIIIAKSKFEASI